MSLSDWAAGYVADVGYTYGYYTELNPLRIRLAFLNAGLAPPTTGFACELGFGQGMSTNIFAAASMVQWYGNDFNPAQAAFAQELASIANSGAQLTDESFDEFCSRPDIPNFDYIGLHGIWSWISDDNRRVIVDFIRRKLKVGGVLYISYNAAPAWSAMVPMRELLILHSKVLQAAGTDILDRVEASLAFAERLSAVQPLYFAANPQIRERLKKIREQDRKYLAHEYFNGHWEPMSFASMVEWLTPAKLQWACSAHLLDAVDAINLTPDQQKFLGEIPDRMFREAARDLCVNQQFRKDYWVKGARQLTLMEQAEALRAQQVVLISPRSKVKMTVTGALGMASLQASIYEPILNLMADYKPVSLGSIENTLKSEAVSFSQIVQAIIVLCGAGIVAPAQDQPVADQVRKRTSALNLHLMRKARSSNDIVFLASPIIGGGVPVPRFHQLFLLARKEGLKRPEDWAQYVWKCLSAQGQRLAKDGAAVEDEAENISMLTKQATEFYENRLPLLKALMIA